MSIIEKYNCGNCDFWQEDAALSTQETAKLVHSGSDDLPKKFNFGHCRKDPPTMMLMPTPHPMDPRQMMMKLQRYYPITQPGEICSHHPMLKADVWRGFAATVIRLYQHDLLDYKPGQHRDEIAAGFNRIPTFAEAKALAQAVNEKPSPPATGEKS